MHRLRGCLLLIAVIGLAASVFVALSTFLPGAPVVSTSIVFVLVPLALLLNLRSAWVWAHLRRLDGTRLRGLSRLPGVPRLATRACGAWFVLAATVAFIAITETKGQPTAVRGRYYLNEHGSYTRVSHTAYLHAQMLELRISSLIASVFFAFAVLANLPSVGRALGEVPKSAGWRTTRWWFCLAWIALGYGIVATLAWGPGAGLVWILGGVAMMVASRRVSPLP
ncbi:MAG TPA: hypothetical protein VMB91_02605 [Solirubrobacteraceae bacterium]|nr:hypothetical protein [Solirubrobacteraceae bacterium]